MSDITVGDVDLPVQHFTGWAYPQFGNLVRVLSDGSTVNNEVLQGGGSPRRRATLSGVMLDAGDIATLHGYNLSKEVVEVSETDGGETVSANVLDFSVDRSRPWLWSYSLSLVEADSGS